MAKATVGPLILHLKAFPLECDTLLLMLNKNSLAVKKCKANQKSHGYKQPKPLISSKDKKLNIYESIYLNDIQ